MLTRIIRSVFQPPPPTVVAWDVHNNNEFVGRYNTTHGREAIERAKLRLMADFLRSGSCVPLVFNLRATAIRK